MLSIFLIICQQGKFWEKVSLYAHSSLSHWDKYEGFRIFKRVINFIIISLFLKSVCNLYLFFLKMPWPYLTVVRAQGQPSGRLKRFQRFTYTFTSKYQKISKTNKNNSKKRKNNFCKKYWKMFFCKTSKIAVSINASVPNEL